MRFPKRVFWIVPGGMAICMILLSGALSRVHFASPARQIHAQYLLQLDSLYAEVEHLNALAARQAPLGELQAQLIRSRLMFKRCEWLAAHLDPEFVKDHLNGPPLPKVERNSPSRLSVLQPEGLQILDDLLFGGEGEQERAAIAKKAANLHIQAGYFVKGQRSLPPAQDRLILEACRSNLVRIFTLGLTGFDTPASGNALPEARVSFRAAAEALGPYLDLLPARHQALRDETQRLLAEGARMLAASNDFDRFDRLSYLREVSDPLYARILDIHLALGIETREETLAGALPQPWNYRSRSLFAPDFLDAGFYGRAISVGGSFSRQQTELGKLLFFDPLLSSSNRQACASCHDPRKAFTDGLPRSLASDGEGSVARNAPTLLHAVYSMRYFHDMRSEDLGKQAEHVIVNPQEFNTTYFDIFDKLKQSPEYVQLFAEAFPGHSRQPISVFTFSTALSAYVSSLVGWNSPFDRHVRGENDALSEPARRGFNLFMGKAACGTCHFAPVFNGTVPPEYSDSESEVLGVPAEPAKKGAIVDPDPGRWANGRMTERTEFYRYSFKTPSVRNAALTAPYMHNGVYKTLEEVMEFYNIGGGEGLGLGLEYQTLPPAPLGLSKREIRDIIAFMESLSDTAGLTAAPRRLPDFPAGSPLQARAIGGAY